MNYSIPLWQHQKEAIEKAKEFNEFAFFFEMGTGKTATVINLLRFYLEQNKKYQRTLILCPPIVLENWRNEFFLHAPEIPRNYIQILYKSGKARLQKFVEKKFTCPIFITNYESLLMPPLFAEFMAWKPEVLIVDESHRCKDMRSKRTKQTIKLADISEFRYLLSGTPILNTPMDIFSQYRIMDRGSTFGQNFFVFRNKHFQDKNIHMPHEKYFPNWQIRPGALDAINKKIYQKAMRITKAECLDLPPLVRKKVYIDLNEDQQKTYDSMKKHFIAFLNDKACVASIALTKILRLQQIVSGFVMLDDKSEVLFNNTQRIKILEELITELSPNHKILIWAVFHTNYEQIRKCLDNLSIKYVEVHGEISGPKKFWSVKQFNENPEIRCLIGHPGSGGIGINLTAADVGIFYSRDFSLEHDVQAESRNHRGGSEIHKSILRIDIVARDTIDEIILRRLGQKQTISEKILKEIAEELQSE